jgi:hypothetical protein
MNTKVKISELQKIIENLDKKSEKLRTKKSKKNVRKYSKLLTYRLIMTDYLKILLNE